MKTPTTKSKLRRKVGAARRSLTVWFSASVPMLLAGAEALKDNLPALDIYLSGWQKVAVAATVSAIVIALRLRKEGRGD